MSPLCHHRFATTGSSPPLKGNMMQAFKDMQKQVGDMKSEARGEKPAGDKMSAKDRKQSNKKKTRKAQ